MRQSALKRLEQVALVPMQEVFHSLWISGFNIHFCINCIPQLLADNRNTRDNPHGYISQHQALWAPATIYVELQYLIGR
jgi:hypothetical protein